MVRNEVVFRRPPLTILATVAMIGIGGLVPYTVLSQPGIYWQTYLGVLVFVGLEYLFWLIGWHSAIRVSGGTLIVDNALLRHRIPLSGISVRVEDGLQIVAADGGRIGSISFGGSAIGGMSGYRHARRVADRIKTEIVRNRARVVNSGYSAKRATKFHLPWIPLLGLTVLFEAIVFAASLFQ